MNTRVNFEIAKLLKEKGWKNPTLHYFFEGGELRENVFTDTVGMDYGSEFEVELSEFLENWNDGRVVNKNGNYCFGCSKSKGYFDTYSAPTVADVVMWLYKTHSIWVEVHGWTNQPVGEEIWKNCFQAFVNGDAMNVSIFKTPTEAYEAVIEYCVKNLI